MTSAALVTLVAGAASLHGQEVVQPLPASGSAELADALQRLANNGNDVSALLDAGDAAIDLGDVAAAIGFFGRAEDLQPGSARASYGLARAYTLARRPVEALQLYARAETAGVDPGEMAAARGLAFDLVGDARTAQQLYRIALEEWEDDEVRRNLGLSHAISGDRDEFEATLLPLLEDGDFAAFRTRAFGLAILGDVDAAIEIARSMMPARSAAAIEPYLRYMPDLTPAQQAAAGSLGVFPRSAAVGRDDAQIAAYDPSAAAALMAAQNALEPRGAPMGRRAEVVQTVQAPTPEPTQSASEARQPSLDQAFAEFNRAPVTSSSPSAGAVDITAIEAPRETSESAPATHPAREWVQVATGRDIEALGFDWRRISRNAQGELAGKNAFTAPWGTANRLLAGPYESAAEAREVVARLRAIGIDSFTFRSSEGEQVFPIDGARPAPAVTHPARAWVQVATGRDTAALAFDWRRLERQANGELSGKGPFVAEWGNTNRLLAGPYGSEAEARAAVNRLNALGIDTFPFNSEAGQIVEPLD